MWYGLFEDNFLISVKYFKDPPTIFDFNSFTSTRCIYDVIEIEIYVNGSLISN